MTKLLLLTFSIVLASCTPMTETEFKTSASAASSSNAPSKWPSSAFPLNVKISNDFDNLEITAVEDMADAWNDSVDYDETFIQTSGTTNGIGNNLDSYIDATIGVYKLTSWPSELPGTALAVTQIFGTRKNVGKSSEYIRIDHADILMNYANFTFKTDGSFGYDFKTIVLHEMGHLIGLYHDESSVEESVMYPSITRLVNNQYPLQRDISTLRSKYGLSSSGNRAMSFRTPAGAQDETQASDNEEQVIIQFEIMADGSENTKLIKR